MASAKPEASFLPTIALRNSLENRQWQIGKNPPPTKRSQGIKIRVHLPNYFSPFLFSDPEIFERFNPFGQFS
jgi:hypothetical protein